MSYPAQPSLLPHRMRCQNHPDRDAVGICVSCRTVVCVECATKIDRMNYCIRCLQATAAPAQAARRENPLAAAAIGIPLTLLGLAGTALIFAALGFLLAMLRHWAPGGVTAG